MFEPVFQTTVDLLVKDVRDAMDSKGIEVRDKRKELELLSNRDAVSHFAAATKADLLSVAAPLMQWRNIRGDEDAYRFDLLVTRIEEAVLKNSPRVADLKADRRGRGRPPHEEPESGQGEGRGDPERAEQGVLGEPSPCPSSKKFAPSSGAS